MLESPHRKWDNQVKTNGIYVIPNGKKHDSGFSCMDIFIEVGEQYMRGGGGCDDIQLSGSHFRIDCAYPERVIHIWNPYGFTVEPDLSTITLRE